MDYKIIVDSASNRVDDSLFDENIGYSVAPLTIHVGDKEYRDTKEEDVASFLDEITTTKEKVKTSCPSPRDYLSKRKDRVHYILITIASRLSGSFNSARLAKEQSEKPENVIVIDSGLAAGAEELLVKEAVSSIKQGLPFETIKENLEKKRDDLDFVFGLSSLDALANSGRFPKPIALLVRKLHRKLIGTAKDGKLSVKERKHSRDGLLQGRLKQIEKRDKDRNEKDRIISYTGNKEDALKLKDRVLNRYPNIRSIEVRENRLLCSFYASKDGLMLSY